MKEVGWRNGRREAEGYVRERERESRVNPALALSLSLSLSLFLSPHIPVRAGN